MIKSLRADLQIRCQRCDKISMLKEWDNNTYKQCVNREMKRLYMHLYNPKAFNKRTGKFYKCPKCGEWLGGHQLYVISDNPEESALGGESIIQFIEKE